MWWLIYGAALVVLLFPARNREIKAIWRKFTPEERAAIVAFNPDNPDTWIEKNDEAAA